MIAVSLIWAFPVTLAVAGYLAYLFRKEQMWQNEIKEVKSSISILHLKVAAMEPKVQSLTAPPPRRPSL